MPQSETYNEVDYDSKTAALKQRLVSRYSLALGLIACVLLLTYATLTIQLNKNEADARQINISGMQRMLSQRIALQAIEIAETPSADDAREMAGRMQDAVDLMLSNHKELLASHDLFPMTDEMHDLYYGAHGIDGLVTDYTDTASKLLTTFRGHGRQAVAQSPQLKEIISTANSGILQHLNAVVYRYQEEAEQKVAKFSMLETMFLLLGLITLTLEAIFIFRPMANEIVSKTKSLEKTNTELIEFSYRISHDLRAPVISSYGLAQTAERGIQEKDTEVSTKALAYIKDSMVKLDTLIEDIINLTRMKMSDVMFEDIDLSDLVTATLEKMKALENYDKMVFKVDIKGDKKIRTARLYFQQSLENLVSNAIKYADLSEDQPFLDIRITTQDHKSTVIVTDNGLGIDEKYRSKIFGMFQRFHTGVSFGSGLGLYLVKQNIGILNGSVKYAKLDSGSEFGFEVPVKKAS